MKITCKNCGTVKDLKGINKILYEILCENCGEVIANGIVDDADRRGL